jgi:hypothetical protein
MHEHVWVGVERAYMHEEVWVRVERGCVREQVWVGVERLRVSNQSNSKVCTRMAKMALSEAPDNLFVLLGFIKVIRAT